MVRVRGGPNHRAIEELKGAEETRRYANELGRDIISRVKRKTEEATRAHEQIRLANPGLYAQYVLTGDLRRSWDFVVTGDGTIVVGGGVSGRRQSVPYDYYYIYGAPPHMPQQWEGRNHFEEVFDEMSSRIRGVRR